MNPATSTQQDSGKFGSKPNYLSAMLSITLILFILGIFGFILINTRQLISFYKENLNLIIEISETGTEEEMVSMKSWLTTRDFYKNGSFSMIPKEEAMQMMRKDFGEDFLKLDLPKDKEGKILPDAVTIRLFRRLWETEQTIVHGDRIYAQTRFQMDGDLTNRFVEDLFSSGKGRFDPKMVELIFRLHHQAVENAESQWSKLIDTCVGLIKSLAQRK